MLNDLLYTLALSNAYAQRNAESLFRSMSGLSRMQIVAGYLAAEPELESYVEKHRREGTCGHALNVLEQERAARRQNGKPAANEKPTENNKKTAPSKQNVDPEQRPQPMNNAVRAWFRNRVESWPDHLPSPSESKDIEAVTSYFAPGLTRKDIRVVRTEETPLEWRPQGRRRPWGEVKDQ